MSSKKVKTSVWTVASETSPHVEYDSHAQYCQIKACAVNPVGRINEDMYLFCRKEFNDQIQVLKERVAVKHEFACIYGPPGTGKSSATYIFACQLVNAGWIVTWIRLAREKVTQFLRFEDGKVYHSKLKSNARTEPIEDFLDAAEGKSHLVVIDGYAGVEIDIHHEILTRTLSWRDDDRANRYVAMNSSMCSLGKVKKTESIDLARFDRFIPSWSDTDFEESITGDDFFRSIAKFLDAETVFSASSEEAKAAADCDDGDDDPAGSTGGEIVASSGGPVIVEPEELTRRKSMLKSKGYFAGQSARYMFGYTLDEVIEDLRNAINAADVMPYLKGTIGISSHSVVNRLIACFGNPISSAGVKISVVSQFVAAELARKQGVDFIRQVAQLMGKTKNPSMNGWFFEMWFFALLAQSGGVKVLDSRNILLETWPEAEISDLDPDNPTISDSPMWMKPLKWNQGGYNAVYVDREQKMVRFVQLTCGKTHELKLEHFSHLLKNLCKQFTIEFVHIYFLVPAGKINDFKISRVSGLGLLKNFKRPDGNQVWARKCEKQLVFRCGLADYELS